MGAVPLQKGQDTLQLAITAFFSQCRQNTDMANCKGLGPFGALGLPHGLVGLTEWPFEVWMCNASLELQARGV